MTNSKQVENYLILPKIPLSIKRPNWTVIIPTYNCANYLRETLQSVLQQDLGEDKMQIIVVDDCSTKDNPEEVVKELAGGRVMFIRQKQNVGKVRNYETGMMASTGRYIHQLHGDDKVRPGFYAVMENLLLDNPQAGAGFCRSLYINAEGQWTGLQGMEQLTKGILIDALERLYVSQRIQTPAMVVKREVYETIGLFNRNFNCMEDWEMWFRIACKYPIAYTTDVLAEYRIHSQNATYETFSNGAILSTIKLLKKIADDQVSLSFLKKNKKKRDKSFAEFLLQSAASDKLKRHQKMEFISEALKGYFSFFLLLKALRVYAK